MLVLFVVVMEFEDELYSNYACIKLKEFKDEEWHGTVTSLFIDSLNHNAETFEISNDPIKHPMFLDGTKFYKFLQVGDSLAKTSNSDTVFVYREDTIRAFRIDFDCNKNKKSVPQNVSSFRQL